jgi:hypothetical protein
MFDFVKPEPWYTRVGRGVFPVITPIVFIAYSLRGRPSTIYLSMDPFWISNYLPSSLPPFLAELIGYDYYVGTVAALLLGLICAVLRRRSPRSRCEKSVELVWYLPAFVAGLEATRHTRLIGSRHGFTFAPTVDELRASLLAAFAASVVVVLSCVALGVVFARVAGDRTRIPVVMLPLGLSVAANWLAVVGILG